MFSGESKYGYQDGEHFANWGDGYPLFARVVNGELYAVAREENPNWGPERFFHMFSMSREWLKNTIFADYPTDANSFADKPNVVEDFSVPGNQFIKSADKSKVLKRPNLVAIPVPPSVTVGNTPPSTTVGDPYAPTTTGNPTTTPPATPATTGSSVVPTGNLPINLATVTGSASSSVPSWVVIALVSLAVAAVVGVIFWKKRK